MAENESSNIYVSMLSINRRQLETCYCKYKDVLFYPFMSGIFSLRAGVANNRSEDRLIPCWYFPREEWFASNSTEGRTTRMKRMYFIDDGVSL